MKSLHFMPRWRMICLLVCLLSTAARADSPLPVYGVAASSSYPGYAPQNAVDGNPSTMWNAGTTGTAQPFLQLDLGSEISLSRLELVVSQYPSGATTHQLVGYTNSWVAVNLGSFSGYTYEGLTLVVNVTNPTPVRWVRIVTTYDPSWVAWFEVRAYRNVPVGSLSASPTQCAVPYNGTFCSSQVLLQAGISAGAYGRVWVAEAPAGAPELGGWVFDTALGSTYVGWIREGRYRFDLREGATSSGQLLQSIYVTGVRAAPPPPPAPKLFGYFGTWQPGFVDSINDTLDHTNFVWASPFLDRTSLKAMLGRSDVSKVMLDGFGILYGSATCGATTKLVYFDGSCTPTDQPQLPTASQRYQYLISQLSPSEYRKIAAVFPIDEPDIQAGVTDANLAAAKQVLVQAASALFPSTGHTPAFALLYSWVAVPMTGQVTPKGAGAADWVAFNCYPVSYGSATSVSPSLCGIASDPAGIGTILNRFERLKALVPNKKYFLVAETALKTSTDNAQGRSWLATNLTSLRQAALADPSVLGVIGFNWRGLDPAYDVSQGEVWKGPALLQGAPLDFKAKVIQEGKCITRGQCP
ncbi:discoidin domain-containing protein [Vitiosangium sp. GDMCC 1.1324]|uniref:discoidin domain-containing protein n=1 Tax=Vitiosangium sp. (strain GDMCC 1.1324) TaxID=2138576 RepID=UPI00130E9B0B|nr:discoidin domain-containing protein [Vitiosangium sp. GDMCC 1.1324]